MQQKEEAWQQKKEEDMKKEEDRKKEEAKMSVSRVKHLLSNGFLDSVSEVMQQKEEAWQRKEEVQQQKEATGKKQSCVRLCSHLGCLRSAHTRGICRGHGPRCSHEGCKKVISSRNVCRDHDNWADTIRWHLGLFGASNS